ncbi:hypothetical protein FNF27_05486 [Cafeteria roenbergensis]|uniref:Uncharacterized protein n=2 Tax=Cafeteria roenbergensis TaxID=33653 RepID=A0A5A8DLT8_CAFRO|nr:hypothetical protein FNF29_08120 [Cafeteria roenbergensis]KAA0166208.1 hypothetical protein FNF31_01434 [Cafeteria roenbergensis]KAA0169586.1 hypothetical protein FNF28_02030 [Cafeteria roenbergensis]KAA0172995.1 hypothetical protein FNF27_05486 [Cafeteria roenbergensis]|eukprot:KAA0146305.1 hypothetical protein FNF29_08120 [Cafeteria roenbergensis]
MDADAGASAGPGAGAAGAISRSSRAPSQALSWEAREMAAFTGKPQINPTWGRAATPARSRYMQAARASAISRTSDPAAPDGGLGASHATASGKAAPLPTGLEECTFAPRVNEVPAGMGNASVYTRVPVFDRLSGEAKRRQERQEALKRLHAREEAERVQREAEAARGRRPDGAGGAADHSALLSASAARQSRVKEMAEFAQSGGSRGASGRGFDSEGEGGEGESGRAPDAGEAGGAGPAPTAEERARRARAHQAFMQRQEAALRRREEHAQAVREATQPAFAPKLCKRSLDLVTAEDHGTFLERVRKTAVRQEHEVLRERATRSRDPHCTFRPAINPVSAAMPARTADELSRGDAIQRETRIRLARLRLEQSRSSDAPFRPTLNANSAAVEGRLRVLQDPEGYIERVQREAAIASDKQRRAAAERETKEVDECTFRPEVHDAPAYVKRIARSMALTRVVRPAPEVTGRPDWR